jgi:hypothetical protein
MYLKGKRSETIGAEVGVPETRLLPSKQSLSVMIVIIGGRMLIFLL